MRDTSQGRGAFTALLIGDDDGEGRPVQELLAASGIELELRRVRTVEAGAEALRSDPCDVALLHPASAEAVRRLREAAPDVPVVAVLDGTGGDGEGPDPNGEGPDPNGDVSLRLLEAGSAECLGLEELTPDGLAQALRRARARALRERPASERRARNRAVVESLPDHLAVLDAEGRIVAVNAAWRDFAAREGGDPRGYEGESYLEVTESTAAENPAARRTLDGIRAVLAGERPRFTAEYPCHGPETRRWFRLTATPLRGSERGEVVVVHTDITDRKLAEEHLRRSEERFRSLFEDSRDAILIVDAEGRVLEANDAMVEIFGYASGELERIRTRDLYADPDRFEALQETILERGYVKDFEIRCRRNDGSTFPGLVTASTRYGPEGDVVGYQGILRDVTEERRLWEALRERELHFRQLVEATNVVLWELDPGSWTFTYVAPQVERVFGYPRETWHEPGFWQAHLHPDDREEAIRFCREQTEAGRDHEFEYRFLHADGHPVWVHDLVSVTTSRSGEPRLRGVMMDVTERNRFQERLRHQALHDPLTGVANRHLLEDHLRQAFGRARRHGGLVALLMVDLDRFKRINDSLGHTAGDRVLESIARRLAKSVRQEDTVARWGGDEFCVLLADLETTGDVEAAWERIRTGIEEPIRVAGQKIEVGAAVGAVLHGPPELEEAVQAEEPDDLLRYADRALHLAKRRVGSSLHLFQPARDGGAEAVSLLQAEQDLRRGIEADEFEPFYQPIVRLDTGRVWAVEALARWRHPERGLVTAGEFIPLAEETNLIHRLGRRIFARACRQVAEWNREAGLPEPIRLMPNVSGREFEVDGFVERVRSSVGEAELDPSLVWLEVTETSLIRATDRIERLRKLGLRVLVDDFGMGYSSLRYLRDLEVDGLKIDMSFVQGALLSHRDAAIVETILTLGRVMRLMVTAEGIETEGQLERLREMGCRLGQGFWFAPALPAEEMTRRLADSGAREAKARGA